MKRFQTYCGNCDKPIRMKFGSLGLESVNLDGTDHIDKVREGDSLPSGNVYYKAIDN